MVYKKYIKRDGKIYGPYAYHSRRVGNKVVTHYVGRGRSSGESKRFVFLRENMVSYGRGSLDFLKRHYIPIFFAAVFIFIIIIAIYNIQPTSRAVLELDVSGKEMKGFLNLNLRQGELVPLDTRVRASLGGQEKEFLLSDLIDMEGLEGDYYLENISVSGSGRGYGFTGEKTVYPDVFFTMVLEMEEGAPENVPSETATPEAIIPNENITEPSTPETAIPEIPENVTGPATPEIVTPPETTEIIVAPEVSPTETGDGASETGEAGTGVENPGNGQSSENEGTAVSSGGLLTGAVVSEEMSVDGNVSGLRNFSFYLDGYGFGRFENVYTLDKKLNSGVLNYEESDLGIIVSTSYSEKEAGFGQDYLGDVRTIKIPIEKLQITPEDGVLNISLSYNGIELVEAVKEVVVEKAGKNESEEKIITNESIVNISTRNITVNVSVGEENASLVERPVIGKPVKWRKSVVLETGEGIVKLPKEAEQISVKKKTIGKGITGEVINGGNGFSFSEFFKRIFSIFTGRAVDNANSDVVEKENSKDVVIRDEPAIYEIEYFTPAPESAEEIISKYRKRVFVSGPDLGYENILTYTTVEGIVPIGSEGSIRVYWIEGGSYEEFTALDKDEDGFLDYIEWNTPHLSNQSFEISLSILNVQSYPEVGGNWTVMFNTTGVADLRIKAVDGTTWTDWGDGGWDLRFLELGCGENSIVGEFVNETGNCESGSCYVYAANYSCNETGTEISKVLTPGRHTLRFEFGSVEEYAHNIACTSYINTCPFAANSANSVYCLNDDIQYNAGTCITVTANNVTLVGQGKSINITGSSYYAIWINIVNQTTIRDFIIRITGGSSKGIYIQDNSNNNTLDNNTIFADSVSSGAVEFVTPAGKYNQIINNYISVNGSAGVFGLFIRSAYNNVSGNVIVLRNYTQGNGDGRGIKLATFPYNSTFRDNRIIVSSNNSFGYSFESTFKHIVFYNDTIVVNGKNSNGLNIIISSDNNTFIGARINSTNSDSNTINISGTGNVNISFIGSIINASGSGGYDFIVGNTVGGTINFTNTTTNKRLSFGSSTKLGINFQWYLDANASFVDGTVIAGANISVWNNTNGLIFSQLTNASGIINRTVLLEYMRNYTDSYYTSPYKISGLFGTENYNISVNLTNSTAVNFTFLGAVECGVLSTPNKVYTLNKDVNSTGTCFNITADGVTVDCNGHMINYSTDGGTSENAVFSNNTKNIVIKNCKIIEGQSTGVNGWGIYMINTNDSLITNNTILAIGFNSHAIFFVSNRNNSIISNNITTTGGGGGGCIGGVTMNGGTRDTKIINNNFNSSGSNGGGLCIYTSSGNKIIGNNITTTGGSGNGFYIQGSVDNIVIDNDITTTGIFSSGIYFHTGNNNSFSNIYINALNGAGISVYSLYVNATFKDSIIKGYSAQGDLRFQSGGIGTINFTNVSLVNNNKVFSDSSMLLNVHWYVDAYVNYTNGTNVSGSYINAYNVSGVQRFSDITGNDGRIPRQVVLSYWQNSSNFGDQNNYTFTASNPLGAGGKSQSWNMSMNRFLVFTLDITSSPSAKRFIIADNSGAAIASLDNKGDMYIKGSLFQGQTNLYPPKGSFIIQNSAGGIIAYINSTGYLYLKGSLKENSGMAQPGPKLEIRNSSNDLVSFFDNKGNLNLSGILSQGYENP